MKPPCAAVLELLLPLAAGSDAAAVVGVVLVEGPAGWTGNSKPTRFDGPAASSAAAYCIAQ